VGVIVRWKLTESCQKRFLKALAETRRVGAAAAVAGTSRTQVYKLRQSDPLFAAAWQQALDALDSADHPPPQPVDRGFRARAKLAGALISGEITPREAADLSKLIEEYLNSLELIKLK
jgi:hypothetical protein